MSTMMIFTGNANPELALKISSHLQIPIGQATVGTFSDGETMVEILENVRGKDVFVFQSTCAPANNNLMELLTMADALRRSSAAVSLLLFLILVMPAKTDEFAQHECLLPLKLLQI